VSKIYEVRVSESRDDLRPTLIGRGCFFSRAEAEAKLVETREWFEAIVSPPTWVRRYWVEEIDTTGLWKVPPPPKPRDRFSTRVEKTSPKHEGMQVHVDTLDGDTVVGSYDRNYEMLSTFEPFRQSDRYFALISPNYTATSVMDLARERSSQQRSHTRMGSVPSGSTFRIGGTCIRTLRSLGA
jgi:hypothetical protein